MDGSFPLSTIPTGIVQYPTKEYKNVTITKNLNSPTPYSSWNALYNGGSAIDILNQSASTYTIDFSTQPFSYINVSGNGSLLVNNVPLGTRFIVDGNVYVDSGYYNYYNRCNITINNGNKNPIPPILFYMIDTNGYIGAIPSTGDTNEWIYSQNAVTDLQSTGGS